MTSRAFSVGPASLLSLILTPLLAIGCGSEKLELQRDPGTLSVTPEVVRVEAGTVAQEQVVALFSLRGGEPQNVTSGTLFETGAPHVRVERDGTVSADAQAPEGEVSVSAVYDPPESVKRISGFTIRVVRPRWAFTSPEEPTLALKEGDAFLLGIVETLEGETRPLSPGVAVVSRDTTVANVDDALKLTAVSPGVVSIDLLAPSGEVADTRQVTVVPHPFLSLSVSPDVLDLRFGEATAYSVTGVLDDGKGTVVTGLESAASLVFTPSGGTSRLEFASGTAHAVTGGTTATYAVTFADPALQAASFTPGQLTVDVRPDGYLSLSVTPGALDLVRGERADYQVSGVLNDGVGTVVSGLESSASLVFTPSAGTSRATFDAGTATATEVGTEASWEVTFADPTLQAAGFAPGQFTLEVREPRVASISVRIGENSARVKPQGMYGALEVTANLEPVNGVSSSRVLHSGEYSIPDSYPEFQVHTVGGMPGGWRALVDNGVRPVGTVKTMGVTLQGGLTYLPGAVDTFDVTVVAAPTSADLSVDFEHYAGTTHGKTMGVGNGRPLRLLADTTAGPFRVHGSDVESVSAGYARTNDVRRGWPLLSASSPKSNASAILSLRGGSTVTLHGIDAFGTSEVDLVPQSASVPVGGTTPYSVNLTLTNGTVLDHTLEFPVRVTSTGAGLAETAIVSGSGEIRGLAAGQITLTAISHDRVTNIPDPGTGTTTVDLLVTP